MPLTVRFHEHLPVNISKWRPVNPNEAHVKYKVYEETICRREYFKIVLGILLKSFFTLGTYYFIVLRCTDDGKEDLKNLKKRVFVHYLPNYRPNLAKVERVSKEKVHLVSEKGIALHTELVVRNQLKEVPEVPNRLKDTALIQEIPLTSLFKIYMKQVQDLRLVCAGVKDIIQSKRAYFLEHLHQQNLELSAAIEKFSNLGLEQQDSYQFIRLLTPFLKDQDFLELLKKAVEVSKKAQHEKKSIYHEKFEEYHEALNRLDSKVDWMIAIHKNKKLFLFVEKMSEFGEHYSPRFGSFYENFKSLYTECLQSMNQVKVKSSFRKELEENFLKWKKSARELQKNLARGLGEKTFGVSYTLADYLEEQLEKFGFDETFQWAVNANKIDFAFIDLFFSGKAQAVLQNIDKLLMDEKIKQAAMNECRKKIQVAKDEEEKAIKEAEEPATRLAFEKMKKCFIQSPDYNDAVFSLVEMELILKTFHPEQVDARFFDFMHTLKQSSFFIKGEKALCDKEFYHDFHNYFTSIDLLIAQIKSIVKKI